MKTLYFGLRSAFYLFAFLMVYFALLISCSKGSSTNPTTITTTKVSDTIGTATGTVDPNNPASYTTVPAITLNGKTGMTIYKIATTSITLNNCTNITIRDCKIGPNATVGITTNQCTNIVVDSCYISNVSTGVYASSSQTISVTNCLGKNMQGPYPKGAFVQFDGVSGGGNKVSYNKFENTLGQSSPEDAISMYKSSGLSTDPIIIEGNWIRGGGPSLTGGGIMLGDNGGSNITARNNILADPGQYGMAVSGGTNMSILNNTIYGKSQLFTNVGLYYWNQSGLASSNITISGNKVNFTSAKFGLNNLYLGVNDIAPTGWSTNIYDPSLDESVLPADILTQAK